MKGHCLFIVRACADPDGTGDPDPPLKNHKNIGSLSNTCPDHKNHKAIPSQHSMLGHDQPTSETPF